MNLWRDSYECVTWLIHMWVNVWRDSFVCERMCHVTHSYVSECDDSYVDGSILCWYCYRVANTHRMPQGAPLFSRKSHVAHANECFRKRASKYRAPLQKMTWTHNASDGSSPPCLSLLLKMWLQMWRDSFIWTWLMHVCDMTPLYVYWCGYVPPVYGTTNSNVTWTSHYTFECVMSHLNESRHITNSIHSCHIWVALSTSHDTFERVMSLLNESRHIMNSIPVTRMNTDVTWFKCDMTFEWGLLHYKLNSCHTNEYRCHVIQMKYYLWMRHVAS